MTVSSRGACRHDFKLSRNGTYIGICHNLGERDDKEFYCKLQEYWRNYGCIPILIPLRYSAGQKKLFIFSFSHSPFSSSFPMVLPFFSSMSQHREVNSQSFCCTSPGLGFQCAPSYWAGGSKSFSVPCLTPCDCFLPTLFSILLWNWDGVQSLLVST